MVNEQQLRMFSSTHKANPPQRDEKRDPSKPTIENQKEKKKNHPKPNERSLHLFNFT